MIRRLSLDELIDAAKNLQSTEQIALVAALTEQLIARCQDVPHGPSSSVGQPLADNWFPLAMESLSRAYGQSEPDYSDEDLVP